MRVQNDAVGRVILIAAILMAALAQAEARGGRASATAFFPTSFYRGLLARNPVPLGKLPPYWFAAGGWPAPLYTYVQQRLLDAQPAPPPPRAPSLSLSPSSPKTVRVPAAYLELARANAPTGPMWVKTERGFRLVTD